MMQTLLAFVLFATAFPSASRTAWMRPESFHLVVGLTRQETEKRLSDNGWKARRGDSDDQLLLDYTDTKALTLQFARGRLRSIRFEYFSTPADAREAFEEQKAFLKTTFGAPKPLRSPTVLIYDRTLPNVMVVLTDQQASGLGMLVVSYYDPAAK